MSYNNFKPDVFAAALQEDYERKTVFYEDCNHEYEGEITDRGCAIVISGLGEPTITTVDPTKRIELDKPEIIEDASQIMYVKQCATFNYAIGDIDQKQSKYGLDGLLKKKTSAKLAGTIDRYISSFAYEKGIPLLYKEPIRIGSNESKLTEGEKYILDVLDEAKKYLWKHDVPDSEKVVCDGSPEFITAINKAYRLENTNNTENLKNGLVGMYNKLSIKMSNNVFDKESVQYIMVRTCNAITAVTAVRKSEAYRPERGFEDAVKGNALFDAKVTNPKEAVVIPVIF